MTRSGVPSRYAVPGPVRGTRWRLFCFCKQKTAYEMRISDWSSDVCSSDLIDKSLPNSRNGAGERGLGVPSIAPRTGSRRLATHRSEERRVGKESVSTCRSRWSPYHETKKITHHEAEAT